MNSKIAAGVGMLLPVFAGYIYYNRKPNQLLTDAVKESTTNVMTMGIALGVGILAGTGICHLVWGVYEVYPKICWRKIE
jgi:hypothetical protein